MGDIGPTQQRFEVLPVPLLRAADFSAADFRAPDFSVADPLPQPDTSRDPADSAGAPSHP